MRKYFIKKNSIAYYIVLFLQVFMLFTSIFTMCLETTHILHNIIIKTVTIISLVVFYYLDKITIK